MNNSLPGQFLLLKGKPLLYYSIQSFLEAYDDVQIILVLAADQMARGQEIIDGYFDASRISLCQGGESRFHSVQNGLAMVHEECVVFVHDGVRCLVTPGLVRLCYEEALKFGTAIPVTDSKDSVRILDDDEHHTEERESIKLVQTPQTFHSKIIIPAYNIEYKSSFTDDASVVEAYGMKVHLVKGELENIKISSPVDLLLAEKIMEKY